MKTCKCWTFNFLCTISWDIFCVRSASCFGKLHIPLISFREILAHSTTRQSLNSKLRPWIYGRVLVNRDRSWCLFIFSGIRRTHQACIDRNGLDMCCVSWTIALRLCLLSSSMLMRFSCRSAKRPFKPQKYLPELGSCARPIVPTFLTLPVH